MKFFGAAILAFSAVAQAVSLAPQVTGNLTQAVKDLQAQNATLNTIGNNDKNIPFATLAKLLNENNAIKADVGNATGASNKSTTFTKAQSSNIATLVSNTKPKIFSVLQNFVRHYPAFKNQGVQGVVLTGLKDQRELIRELGGSLQKKLTPAYAKYAPGNTTQILNAFDAAIKTYSQ